jgi:hypothetical protein
MGNGIAWVGFLVLRDLGLGFLFGDGKECLEIVKGSLRSLVLFDMGY